MKSKREIKAHPCITGFRHTWVASLYAELETLTNGANDSTTGSRHARVSMHATVEVQCAFSESGHLSSSICHP